MGKYFAQKDVFPLIAEIIRSRSAQSLEFVTHEQIVSDLKSDSQLQYILERNPEAGRQAWLVDAMVANFSKEVTLGRNPYREQFDYEKTRGKWAYKARSPKSSITNPQSRVV